MHLHTCMQMLAPRFGGCSSRKVARRGYFLPKKKKKNISSIRFVSLAQVGSLVPEWLYTAPPDNSFLLGDYQTGTSSSWSSSRIVNPLGTPEWHITKGWLYTLGSFPLGR